MPEITSDILAELERLEYGASAGPWKADSLSNVGENWLIGVLRMGHDERDGKEHGVIVSTDNIPASRFDPGDGARTDAEFVAALRNHARELISAARLGIALASKDSSNV